MKRFLSIIFLVIFSLSLASCSRISNPTPESCYNFRCEVTDEDKVFVIEGDDAKSIYSECNKNMQNATLSSDAIGTGEYIKIKFIGDKRPEPKKSSDTVLFSTLTIHTNDVVLYEGKLSYNYQFKSGFFQMIDLLILLKK